MTRMNFRAPIVIILCAGAVLAVGMGLRGTFGLFMQPISSDLGLSREVFALSIAIQSLVWGVCQPIFGAIADRYGSVRVALCGAVFYIGGLMVMAGAAGPLGLHLGAGVLIGMGLSATGFAVVLGPVSRAVPENKRSVALGIASAGGSFGQFAMAPIGGVLLQEMGWVSAIWIFVFIAALISRIKKAIVTREVADRNQRVFRRFGFLRHFPRGNVDRKCIEHASLIAPNKDLRIVVRD